MMPMMISTKPAVCRLKTDVLVVTAKARIAPTAMSARPTPVFMMVLPLSCRGSRVRGLGPGRIEQGGIQVARGVGGEPGHVHRRDAERFADLGLGQVAVE